MVSKAQCMSGLVKRTLGPNAPMSIQLQLYLSHVRSLLEYCRAYTIVVSLQGE